MSSGTNYFRNCPTPCFLLNAGLPNFGPLRRFAFSRLVYGDFPRPRIRFVRTAAMPRVAADL